MFTASLGRAGLMDFVEIFVAIRVFDRRAQVSKVGRRERQ